MTHRGPQPERIPGAGRAALAALLVVGALVACKVAEQGGTSAPTVEQPPPPPPTEAPDAPATPAVPVAIAGDGVPAVDPKLARNFYVVFDGSGSMSYKECSGDYGKKLPAAQWAFQEFLTAVPDEANLGLLVFDKAGVREVVKLGPSTREAVRQGVLEIRAGQGTPLGKAVKLATKALASQREVQLGYGEYNLVVVTDGQADDEADLRRAVKDANAAGVLIQTIGFCINDVSALKKGSFSYRSASDPAELREAVLGVLAEAEDFSSLEFEKVD